MPLPTNKNELLEKLHQAYNKLDAEFETINSTQSKQKKIEGSISCCDILAYQIGWGHLLLSWETSELKGKTAVMPSPDFKWNQLGELANSFYAHYKNHSLDELRSIFMQLYKKLSTWIKNLSDDELFKPHSRYWTGEKWAMVKWIQINTIAPYQSARTKVRRWKREEKIT